MTNALCRQPADCKVKTPGKACGACRLSAMSKDPAIRERRRASLSAAAKANPEHSRASQRRLAEWRAATGHKPSAVSRANLALANTPDAKARRIAAIKAKAYDWCPADRLDEYKRLCRQMPAAEARAIIEADIPGTAANAVRQVAQNLLNAHLRHAREVEQRY